MNANTPRRTPEQSTGIILPGGCDVRLGADGAYLTAVALTPCTRFKLSGGGRRYTVEIGCWPVPGDCALISDELARERPVVIGFQLWCDGLGFLTRLLNGTDPSNFEPPFGYAGEPFGHTIHGWRRG